MWKRPQRLQVPAEPVTHISPPPPASVNHQGQFPSVRYRQYSVGLALERGPRWPAHSTGDASEKSGLPSPVKGSSKVRRGVSGTRLAHEPILDRRPALLTVSIVWEVLIESQSTPSTIFSHRLPRRGGRAAGVARQRE